MSPLDVLFEGVCKSVPLNGGEAILGAIHFVFKLVQNSESAFEAVLEFFVQIGERIPIIKTLNDTFRDSAIVANAAQRLFAALIEFWSHAVKSYRGLGYHLFKATFSLKPRFEKLKKELDDQFVYLKDAATAQHYQNSEQILRSQRVFLKGMPWTCCREASLTDEYRPKDDSVINWLRASNYAADFKKARKKRYQGTCTWILTRPEYREWLAILGKGALLVIYGIPGAGKTILSSFLIEQALELNVEGATPHFVLYHYFKADNDTKNTSTAAVRSLLESLFNELLASGAVEDFRERYS